MRSLTVREAALLFLLVETDDDPDAEVPDWLDGTFAAEWLSLEASGCLDSVAERVTALGHLALRVYTCWRHAGAP